jgi:hypothetical protein
MSLLLRSPTRAGKLGHHSSEALLTYYRLRRDVLDSLVILSQCLEWHERADDGIAFHHCHLRKECLNHHRYLRKERLNHHRKTIYWKWKEDPMT